MTGSNTGTVTLTLTLSATSTLTSTPVLSALAITKAVTFPNPVRSGGLTFSVWLTTDQVDYIRITVYTLSMYQIKGLLVPGGHFGENQFSWDIRDEHGTALANGLYYYLVEASKQSKKASAWGKLVVLR